MEPYRKATVLLARDNFGCGSSREHAPWALGDFGFRLIIAPSFADIFYNNCVKNGILLARFRSEEIDEIFAYVEKNKGAVISADLPSQTVTAGGKTYTFQIDAFNKECLLKGLDGIGWSLQFEEKITAYENKIKSTHPWLVK
jgi:3-isopropylmalate/(R)-2-methylmalate dehydratase small subunit